MLYVGFSFSCVCSDKPLCGNVPIKGGDVGVVVVGGGVMVMVIIAIVVEVIIIVFLERFSI